MNKYLKGRYYFNGNGIWSEKFDQCLECSTTIYIHIAKGKCHKCYFTQYKKTQKYKEYNKTYEKALRLEVLHHYSNGNPQCACCRESHYEFLAIDHINGGGNIERKREHTTKIYSFLKRKNYPDGYQILCHNCNMAKGLYGLCPHKRIHIDSKPLEVSKLSVEPQRRWIQ